MCVCEKMGFGVERLEDPPSIKSITDLNCSDLVLALDGISSHPMQADVIVSLASFSLGSVPPSAPSGSRVPCSSVALGCVELSSRLRSGACVGVRGLGSGTLGLAVGWLIDGLDVSPEEEGAVEEVPLAAALTLALVL